MLDFVKQYGSNITSQNGENGIIQECINRINPKLKSAVEFGAPDKKYCSNIYPLKDFVLHYFDPEPQELGITKKFITPYNINELPKCSVLSIDIDGNDYEVWKAYSGRPDIVIIEINSSLPPDVSFFSPERGSSYCTMVELGLSKGYVPLCHTGNIIFILGIHADLFPDIDFTKCLDIDLYFNKSWL